MKVLIIFFMFFMLCSLIIINNYDLKIFEKQDLNTFFKLYSGWTNKFYNNTQTITSNVIKLDWFPEK